MTNPSFTQQAFRLRNDDGNETGATWRANENTNATIQTSVKFRCRFSIDETASRSWTNKTWNLYFSQNGGAYQIVQTSGVAVVHESSTYYADGDDCTRQLTAQTGTFLTDNNGMQETSGGATNSGAAGNYFEVEFCISIFPTYVSNGDTITLRIYDGSSAIASYNNTPSITVSKPVSGDLSGSRGTLAALTVSAAGTVQALPEITGNLSGSRGTLAALTLDADGTVTTPSAPAYGDLSGARGTLAALTVVGRGLIGATGILSQTLGNVTISAAGTVSPLPTVNGDLSGARGTLAALTVDGHGTVQALPEITGNLSGSRGTLAPLTVDGHGTVGALPEVSGNLSGSRGTLASLGISASGVVGNPPVEGILSQTLGALTVDGHGTVQALPEITGNLSGSRGTLAPLTVLGRGLVGASGNLSGARGTLGALTLDANGVVGNPPVEGSLAQTLAALTVDGHGTVAPLPQINGILIQTLAALTIDGHGTVAPLPQVNGALTQTLAPLTVDGEGHVEPLPANGSLTVILMAVAIVAAGVVHFPIYVQPQGRNNPTDTPLKVVQPGSMVVDLSDLKIVK